VEPTSNPVAPSRAPEIVSQCVQSRECHAEQREASRIFTMLRRRDSSAEFMLSTSKGLRMTLRHSLPVGRNSGQEPPGRERARFEGLIKRANRPIWVIPVAALISIRLAA